MAHAGGRPAARRFAAPSGTGGPAAGADGRGLPAAARARPGPRPVVPARVAGVDRPEHALTPACGLPVWSPDLLAAPGSPGCAPSSGYWSIHARKRGQPRQPGPPVHDDLVGRVFAAPTPNRLWLTDITEHPTAEGTLHLCAVGDADVGTWLNMVETFFGIITRQAIRRGTHRSVRELIAAVAGFIDGWNYRCHPFVWTEDADTVIAKTPVNLLPVRHQHTEGLTLRNQHNIVIPGDKSCAHA